MIAWQPHPTFTETYTCKVEVLADLHVHLVLVLKPLGSFTVALQRANGKRFRFEKRYTLRDYEVERFRAQLRALGVHP